MTNTTPKSDPVNHPTHYTQYPVEVIELTGHMNFSRGNAVKYIARAGFKGGPEKELEDLRKARWYVDYEIKQLEKKLAKDEFSTTVFIPNAKVSFEATPDPAAFDILHGKHSDTVSVAVTTKAKG